MRLPPPPQPQSKVGNKMPDMDEFERPGDYKLANYYMPFISISHPQFLSDSMTDLLTDTLMTDSLTLPSECHVIRKVHKTYAPIGL